MAGTESDVRSLFHSKVVLRGMIRKQRIKISVIAPRFLLQMPRKWVKNVLLDLIFSLVGNFP